LAIDLGLPAFLDAACFELGLLRCFSFALDFFLCLRALELFVGCGLLDLIAFRLLVLLDLFGLQICRLGLLRGHSIRTRWIDGWTQSYRASDSLDTENCIDCHGITLFGI
jgi:hypothetical protein